MDLEQEKQALLDIKAGNKARFATLVDAYKGAIFNLAYRMTGSGSDAEDLVQETFVRAYQNLDSFDSGKRFFPWLYTIGLNLIRRHLKKQGRRILHKPGLEGDLALNPGPEQAFLDKELARQLQSALLKLRPAQREALILRYVQGVTYDEMASILQISNSAAKMRVARGLDQLRSILPASHPIKADHET